MSNLSDLETLSLENNDSEKINNISKPIIELSENTKNNNFLNNFFNICSYLRFCFLNNNVVNHLEEQLIEEQQEVVEQVAQEVVQVLQEVAQEVVEQVEQVVQEVAQEVVEQVEQVEQVAQEVAQQKAEEQKVEEQVQAEQVQVEVTI